MADANKTEKPTQQRRRKARERGQVVRSRELSNALAFGGAITVISWQSTDVIRQWRGLLSGCLDLSISEPLRVNGPALFWSGLAVLRWIVPVVATAWVLSVAGGLMQGGFVFAPQALAPNPERFNPVNKLGQMFSAAGLSTTLKSLLPFLAILWVGISNLEEHWNSVMHASDFNARTYLGLVAGVSWKVCWRSGLILLAWAAIDYALVWHKTEGDLKMTKNEVKDEAKDTQGNPLIKGRMRRLQRQMRRRQMLKDAQKANVVITNPTHFAVALRYEIDMEAPTVIAKGRDLLAQEIKHVAIWAGIPIMENPPLAQALFRTVEVGQQIPAKLYAAVAEILAFVFRAQAQARGAAKPAPTR